MTRALVILSIPFIRVTRVLLTPAVLEAISCADVLIVSPLSSQPEFRAQFEGRRFHFLSASGDAAWPRWLRMVYGFSEMMRMNGFWFRHRNNGLGYYAAAAEMDVGDDGADNRIAGLRAFTLRLANWFGQARAAWRFADRIFGARLYDTGELDRFVSDYDDVTLVQASSWGLQDRMLSQLAHGKSFRTVLLPYTTDQLWVNGHLLASYDMVCAQGPFEQMCAEHYHQVAAERICQLGNLWFRKIDQLMASGAVSRAGAAPRRIIYAGVSRRYFPRESEYRALEALRNAMDEGRFGKVELVYRAFAGDAAERCEIEARTKAIGGIELQWPEEVCAGLDDANGEGIEPQLVQYLNRLVSADVVVMSHTTTLGWDAAYLGCGVVANFADDSGTLERRNTHLRFVKDAVLDCAPGLPVAYRLDTLVDLVAEQMADPAAARRAGQGIVRSWDSVVPDLVTRLRAIILPGAIDLRKAA